MRETPKILIAGAEGMLGRDVRAVFSGKSVTALGRKHLDITNRAAAMDAVAGHTVVINCAAYTKVDEAETDRESAFAVNAIGAENLARAARSAGAVLMQLSTDYVFDGTADEPYCEESPLHPLSVYGESKAEGERLARQANLGNTVIVRTAWLYGQHGPNFAATMARLAAGGKTIQVIEDQFGQPTWTVDVAYHLLRLVDAGVNTGIFHATNSGAANRIDFARAVVVAMGFSPTTIEPVAGTTGTGRAPRPRYSVLGHAAWPSNGLEPMRDWRAALADAIKQGAVTTS